MTFTAIITILIMLIIASAICWLVFWSVSQLPFGQPWKGIVFCILGLLFALLLANYFFGSGPGFPHFALPR